MKFVVVVFFIFVVASIYPSQMRLIGIMADLLEQEKE